MDRLPNLQRLPEVWFFTNKLAQQVKLSMLLLFRWLLKSKDSCDTQNSTMQHRKEPVDGNYKYFQWWMPSSRCLHSTHSMQFIQNYRNHIHQKMVFSIQKRSHITVLWLFANWWKRYHYCSIGRLFTKADHWHFWKYYSVFVTFEH